VPGGAAHPRGARGLGVDLFPARHDLVGRQRLEDDGVAAVHGVILARAARVDHAARGHRFESNEAKRLVD